MATETMHGLTNEERATLARAQALQIRRERWVEVLESLPMPKAEVSDFPYATLDEALDDGFQKLEGGHVRLMQLARKAWKTEQWRAAAERNRKARDAAAELDAKRTEEERIAEAVEEHVR